MIEIRRAVPESGKTLTVALGFAAIFVIIWLLSNAITGGNFQGTFLLGVAVAVLAVVGKILSDWRSGVYLFFVWLLFEDLLRKYMGNSMYIYFAKDLLIGVTYVALLIARLRGEETDRLRVRFKFALGLFVLLGVVQVFNPGSPSFWYGLLGLKLYFYYIPLIFVGYALIRSERDLRRFLLVSLGLAGVIALVGILQTIIGLDFLNPHSGTDIEELGHLLRVTPSGLVVSRPPSVFVSDGRFAAYLILVFILGLGTTGYLLLGKKGGRKIAFPALALIAVAVVVSGSRGSIVWVFVSGLVLPAAMLWGAPPKLAEAYRMVKAIRRAFIFVALTVSLAVILFPQVVAARWAFYRETIALDSPDSETTARAWDYPVAELLMALADRDWAVGHGIGTASLGIQYVSRIMEAPKTGLGVESGYGNLIVELGILGPILWVVWCFSLVVAACQESIKVKGTWAFPVALSISWYAFLLLFPLTWGNITMYQNFVLNAYFWLLVGILFRLPTLVANDDHSLQNSWQSAVNVE